MSSMENIRETLIKWILETLIFFAVALGSALLACAPAQAEKKSSPLPKGFVYVTDVAPDVILEMRYFSTYNFVGARVDGYERPVAILTREAAEALKKAGESLRAEGYVLKIFDAYRPQRAASHFTRWARDPGDAGMKEAFYPDEEKSGLFKKGYIAHRSAHSRGSAVDVTLVEMNTGREADMGSPYDFFGSISHHGSPAITQQQTANREILRKAMKEHGFKPYQEEWWHYTLAKEPYPETYFDFGVR